MSKFFVPDLVLSAQMDAAYVSNRDSEYAEDTRQWLENAWLEYQPLCPETPSEFIKDAQIDFDAAVWQMLLTVFLKRKDFDLEKPALAGPDIIIKLGGRRILIEAVAADAGNGKDRVIPLAERPSEEIMPGVLSYEPEAREFPDRKVIFRIQNSFKNKINQYKRWKELGLVQPTDSFVIAVNGFQVDDLGSADRYPYGVRAMFAMGSMVFSIPMNVKTGVANTAEASSYIQHQPVVEKQSGAPVDSACFMSEEFKEVSGLIYTHNYFNDTVRLEGSDIALIKNPHAQNPIDDLNLGFGQEFTRINNGKDSSYRIEIKKM